MSSPSHPNAAPRDNLLGICNAIGQAFGFEPNYLRVLFILAMLADFPIAIGVYLLCGVAVLIAAAAERVAAPRRGPAIA